MSTYRTRTTEYAKDEVAEEEDRQYIEFDEFNDVIDDIESDVNDIKDMLTNYDPITESLGDIMTALEKLSKNLY